MKNAKKVKYDENFSVKVRIPFTDCVCGTKYRDLRLVRQTYSDGSVCYLIRCPNCGKEAGDQECSCEGLALLAWHRKISKEVKK